MKFNCLIIVVLLQSLCLQAQPPALTFSGIPKTRQLFHDNIRKAQNNIIHLETENGEIFKATTDEEANLQITQVLNSRIKAMQLFIEDNKTFAEADKYKWLRGISEMLNEYASEYKLGNIKGEQLPELILLFQKLMTKSINNETIQEEFDHAEYVFDVILSRNFAFEKAYNNAYCKQVMVLKSCKLYPDNILYIAKRNLQMPFADSLIEESAKQDPENIYNLSAASDAFALHLRKVKFPLTKLITSMAMMNSGRSLFPFLDELYTGNISFDSLDKIIENEDAYFKQLVKTEISYAGRIQSGDTPLVANTLLEKLRSKAKEIYIDVINGLHEVENETIRFKRIEKLQPEELYYLCVLGEDEIYTSSFLGVYKRMIERLTFKDGDLLLRSVNYDLYRKFIKMTAGYNKLDHFLSLMGKETAELLMQKFVTGLDLKPTLEDAVDVADSYASINDGIIRKLMLNKVTTLHQEANDKNNAKGKKIYYLLQTIFNSMDSTSTIDLTKALQIPPVYKMTHTLLQDTSKKINMLMFFYGDKDGNDVFNMFKADYGNKEFWKIVQKPMWIEVSSTKGSPITIYANKPGDETKDYDRQAQEKLINYLDSLGIEPTITIHRGHSYHVKSTISQLPISSKVILLGSCGGYHRLTDVLSFCPEAQIIASKQVGTGVVNSAIINAITDDLRKGKDLNWPIIWKTLSKNFTSGTVKERFDDYVPPQKNLGAIFIMAYNKLKK